MAARRAKLYPDKSDRAYYISRVTAGMNAMQLPILNPLRRKLKYWLEFDSMNFAEMMI